MSSNEDIVAYLDDDETQPITRGELNQAAWQGDGDAVEYLALLAEHGDEASRHSLRMLSATAQAAQSGFDLEDIVPSAAEASPAPARTPEPKDWGSDLDGAIEEFMTSRAEG